MSISLDKFYIKQFIFLIHMKKKKLSQHIQQFQSPHRKKSVIKKNFLVKEYQVKGLCVSFNGQGQPS